MTARVKVAMALRRSTRNSRAIMAPNVLSSVGRGSGASAISAAISAAPGALTGAVVPGGGAFLVVVVILGTPVRSG